jgi:hypothetical protein
MIEIPLLRYVTLLVFVDDFNSILPEHPTYVQRVALDYARPTVSTKIRITGHCFLAPFSINLGASMFRTRAHAIGVEGPIWSA